MKTAELQDRLRAFLHPNEWVLAWNVSNSTGYRKTRTADAVAVGLWPSAGCEIHGFELKVSRSDWLRELKQPDKATELARYCDRWWLVVGDPAVIQPGELPAGWGLLLPHDAEGWSPDGPILFATLKPAPAAPLRVCQQPDRGFIASLLRAASKRDAQPVAAEVETTGADSLGARGAR